MASMKSQQPLHVCKNVQVWSNSTLHIWKPYSHRFGELSNLFLSLLTLLGVTVKCRNVNLATLVRSF